MFPRLYDCLRSLSIAGPALGMLCIAPPAAATMQFQQVFVDEYLADHPDRQFVDFVRCQVKCFACHQGCEDRRNHNPFGRKLADRLDALADRENSENVLSALREVAKLPADPSDPDGRTFGDRIASGELPAGELDDLRCEPAAADNAEADSSVADVSAGD